MKILSIIFAFILGVSAQTWVQRARLVNFSSYFTEAMQHLVTELENNGWCNLKTQDLTLPVNEHMYRWHVIGNVTYANGFVVSMQKIDLTNIAGNFASRVVNGTAQATGTVQGLLNFRDIVLGFDVIFKPQDGPEQRYTGTFAYRLINFRPAITKNYHMGNITTTIDWSSSQPDPNMPRMVFLPADNLTEVLSRPQFATSGILNSIRAWPQTTLQPILNEWATKMEFPSVCFVNC